MDHSRCPACKGPLIPEKDAMDVDDILTDISQLISDLGKEDKDAGAPGTTNAPPTTKAAHATVASRSASRRNEEARAGINRAMDAHRTEGVQEHLELGLPDDSTELDREAAATVPAPGKKSGPEADGEGTKPVTGDGDGEEAYQCLICGSTIPPEAEHCTVCGTIFVDEAEAHSFRGLPVKRLCQNSEIDADDSDLRQTRRAEEIKVEPPLPATGSHPQRLTYNDMPVVEYGPAGPAARADELPPSEFDGPKRSGIKKKIVKKVPRKV